MRTLNNIFESNKNILTNERGSVLIVAVLILMLLTLIGISAIKTTNIEIQISANDKFHKMAFHNADAGVYFTPKVISDALDARETPSFPVPTAPAENIIQYADKTDAADPDFFNELAGVKDHDDAFDISFLNDDVNRIQVDIQRGDTVHLPGGGAEFAAGAEGPSTSSTGIFFTLDSLGTGPASSQSNVGAQYLKVVGVAGGM